MSVLTDCWRRVSHGRGSIDRRVARAARAGLTPRVDRPALMEPLEQRRLLSAGDLDPTFGGGGKLVTAAAPATFVEPNALAFQGSKLLVGGTANGAFFVTRYDSSGALDPTWGGTGGVETPVPGG